MTRHNIKSFNGKEDEKNEKNGECKEDMLKDASSRDTSTRKAMKREF